MSMPPPTPTADVLTELILEVFRVNGDLLAAGNRLTKPSGQTSARWQVLGALRNGPLSVAAIARDMGLARQSVQRTADLLAEDAVVEYLENPAHRRAKLVSLTSAGQSILAEILRRQEAWSHGLAEALPFEEARIQEALEVLRHLRAELERGGEPETDEPPRPHRSVGPQPEGVHDERRHPHLWAR